MYLHQFKYNIKCLLHNKMDIFWVLLFPIALGTFFHIAFSGILDSTEKFHAIKVAIVLSDTEISDNFREIADALGEGGGDQLLSILYTDAENAKMLLKNKEVNGIITAKESITLSVSDAMGSAQIEQSILASFVDEYNTSYNAIREISITNPEKVKDVLLSLNESTDYLKEKSLTNADLDPMMQYFFNLIAMSCLFTSFSGIHISIKNQANLSPIGARKNVSPFHKLPSILTEFFANLIVQFGCLCLVLLYLVLIIKIDFGSHPILVLCSILVSCMLGISLGILVGCIGHLNEDIKTTMLAGISLFSCFLSGLMIGDMRPLMEEYCPIVNRLNPGALISDCFYTLNIYNSYERFFRNIITILIYTAICLFGAFLIVRRKKYANL